MGWMDIFKKFQNNPPPSDPSLPKPVDLSRYQQGGSADLFLKDETNPSFLDPFSSNEEALPHQAAVTVVSRQETLRQPGMSTAQKTMEADHLAHMFHLPMERIGPVSSSLLSQMSKDGFREQTALYAQHAAELALQEKKKKRKKRLLERIRSFLKTVFS